MQRFYMRPEVWFGANALDSLSGLDGRRALVVTDGFLAESGLLDRVTERLTGPVEVFSQVTPDPTLALVAKGVEAFRRFQPEAVVAFGGGSPIDCAKAVMKFGPAPGEARPLFYAIPTTAGTGSEVTSFAVLTNGEVKIPLVDDDLLPDRAILDPGFLSGVPAKVTADTGMDVLTHALEAWVARDANPFTDALAGEAVRLTFQALPKAVTGDGNARAVMLEASCMAGIAFNAAGLGVCHAMAHALGGRFHLAHGRINSIILPAVLRFNGEETGSSWKFGKLASLCGLGGTAQSLRSAVNRLRRQLGMPDRLREAGVDPAEGEAALPQLVEAALADRCLPGNPRQVGRPELERLYREVF